MAIRGQCVSIRISVAVDNRGHFDAVACMFVAAESLASTYFVGCRIFTESYVSVNAEDLLIEIHVSLVWMSYP